MDPKVLHDRTAGNPLSREPWILIQTAPASACLTTLASASLVVRYSTAAEVEGSSGIASAVTWAS